jgi:hypothetical protein
MAPPTLIEFFLTLVVREGIAASAPGLRGSIHLGTKGCLCDFTYNISDARYKVLNAFVCSYCRKQLAADSLPLLADEVEQVLAKAWVGKAADAESPAAILAKLGLNLFTTKALKPGSWERFTTVLTEEGAKQAMRLISYVLVALFGALLVLLGVKAAGPAAEIHTKADSQLEHATRALPPNQTPPSC